MTALFAASREALAEAMMPEGNAATLGIATAHYHARLLIDSGAVRVIDPDDDALVERVTREAFPEKIWGDSQSVKAVLRALVEDKP